MGQEHHKHGSEGHSCCHHEHGDKAKPVAVPTGADVIYTCPMHPERGAYIIQATSIKAESRSERLSACL